MPTPPRRPAADDPRPAHPPTRLHILHPDGRTERLPLTAERYVLGRSSAADITLPEETVSRRHAELTRDPFGRWWVRDLGSHNGTLLHGDRVTETVLEPGATFEIGSFTLNLHHPAGTAHAAPADAAVVTTAQTGVDRLSSISQLSAPRVSAALLESVTAFGRDLLTTRDGDDRVAALCRLMVSDKMHGQHAMILHLAESREARVALRVDGAHAPHASSAGVEPYISRSLCQAVLERREPTMATSSIDADQPRGAVQMSIAAPAAAKVAAIACPLRESDAGVELLYVSLPATHATGEWLALSALAVRQYEAAEASWASRVQAEALAAIEQELHQAHAIQMSLVPTDPATPGIDTAIVFEPCRWVGGDYADALELPDGRTLLVVADVCGKGLQAALTSISLHAIVRSMAARNASLAEIMHRTNDYLEERLPPERFVTAVALKLDPHTGQMTYCNAGHPPPCIVTPGQHARPLPAGQNTMLGVVPGSLQCTAATLDPGDYLVLYSDGVNEAAGPDGEQIGIDGVQRLAEDACATPDAPALTAAKRLDKSVKARLQGRHADDDFSLMVTRRV